MAGDLRKNRQSKIDQKVSCHICTELVPVITSEDHHIVPRAFGGTDDPDNRVWLCASCHTRLHRIQGLFVKGKAAQAVSLCSNIFPTNAGKRGRLIILSQKAAAAERDMKSVNAEYKTEQKVQLLLDVKTWAIIKARAKAQKISATVYAAKMLENFINE